MAHAVGRHVLLPVLLYRPADVRLRHSRHAGRVRPVQADAWLGLDGNALGLCHRPGNQRQPGRQVRRPAHDERRRDPVLRRELGRQLRLGPDQPVRTLGPERLFPGARLGTGEPAAVELVGRERTGQGVRLLRVRRRLCLDPVLRHLAGGHRRAASGMALDLPPARAADARRWYLLLPDRPGKTRRHGLRPGGYGGRERTGQDSREQ